MGKKLRIIACVAIAGLLIWQLPAVFSAFPIDRSGTQNPSWRGVVRVWVCGDWSSGGMSWLSKQASLFEKAHSGVKIRLRRAEPGAWTEEGAVLPDLIVFAPGTIDAPETLFIPIAGAEGFLEETLRSGRWQDEQYALPLALGGYAVIIHEKLWPADTEWRTPETEKKQVRYALHCAQGGGLVALAQWPEGVAAARTLTVHPDLGQAMLDPAYQDFASGRVAAFVCTLDQVRRFAALEAAGKGFPYRVQALPSGFCDQLLLAGIPVAKREADCLAMVETLLQTLTQTEAQNALIQYGLLPVSTQTLPPSNATPTLRSVYLQYLEGLQIPNAYGWEAVQTAVWETARHAVFQDTDALWQAIESVR